MGGKAFPVTVSVGAAVSGANTRDPDELIGRADRALYRAKANGRDRVVAARMDEQA
jgi:diguanylate cyclase (GGDEF)-like protein